MDLRHMRQFVAVAEELHFGRAAKRLNMAQPPLSQGIRRLELELGLDLFDRSKRKVELTQAGHVLLEEARRTLLQAEIARKLTLRAGTHVPELRVSFIGPALYQVLPPLLVRFREAAPDVHVRLFEVASPEQFQGILSSDYDVGFATAGLAAHTACEAAVVERSRFIAAVPANGPLGDRTTISLEELSEQPLIAPPPMYAAQADILDIFKNAGLAPRIAQEASQRNTALSLVGAGLGSCLVMATAVFAQPRNVRFVNITPENPQAPWELAMIWRPERLSKLARTFVEFTKAHVARNRQLLDVNSVQI